MGKGLRTPSERDPEHQPFVFLLSLFCFFPIKLIAEDVDSKPNGQIRFSIVGGDRDNEFAVDPILGLVKVKKKLDRERVSKFRSPLTIHTYTITDLMGTGSK
jgi:hypothetical protein